MDRIGVQVMGDTRLDNIRQHPNLAATMTA